MAVNLESSEADRLARELAPLTGERIATAVTKALHERLGERTRGLDRGGLLRDERGLPRGSWTARP